MDSILPSLLYLLYIVIGTVGGLARLSDANRLSPRVNDDGSMKLSTIRYDGATGEQMLTDQMSSQA